ncbi:MAG: PilZ domain-containing protein, partial [Candidatus Omnitrophica bacterium]|nr:PilZ domain-containing protein [Candidatus Omnitrophota bacterium]
IRMREPISVAYTVAEHDKVYNVTAKDISAEGLRFQTTDKSLKEGDVLEMRLDIHAVANHVHAMGKIMWKKKLSLEDNAPFDVGTEIIDIEEDNKNTFLKFLCDLIYNLPEDAKDAKSKKR